MENRYFNAALGFALGIVTLPLAILFWPIAIAYAVMSSAEDDDEII